MSRIVSLFAASLLVGAAVLSTSAARAEQRVALVIGNSAYKHVSPLSNTKNDANAVGELLRKAGFNTGNVRRDLSVNEMRRAIRDFADQARTADIAVVYYAGHGIEVDGINYLIPTDAVLERDIDAEDEALSLDRVLKVLEPVKRLRLVILDSCRDNPFANKMKRTLAGRFVSRGLAKVEPTMPNTLVAFAAKAGSTAADGSKNNSPFTAALLKHIAEPGLDIRIALGRVRDEVLKETGNKQEPFVYGSLGGDTIALAPERKIEVAQSVPTDLHAPVRRDYELAVQVATKDALNAFLKQYPDGFFAELARAQLTKMLAAEAAETKAIAATAKAEAAIQEAEKAKTEAERARREAQKVKAENALIASIAPPPIQAAPPKTPPKLPETANIPSSSSSALSVCRPDSLQLASAGSAVGGPFQPVEVEPNLAAAKEMRSIAFSPDRTKFGTAGDDGIVRLWDATNFKLIRQYSSQKTAFYSVAFSPDGKWLASAGWGGKVYVLDVASGQTVHVFSAKNEKGAVRQFSAAFSAGRDVQLESAGSDGVLRIWDLQRKALARKIPIHTGGGDPTIRSLAYAPNSSGEFAAAGFDGTIKFFLQSGKNKTAKAYSGKVLQIAYSPAGDRIASAGSNNTKNVMIWDAAQRGPDKPQPIRTFDGHMEYAVSVAWSKDGKQLVSGGGYSDPTLRLWNADSGALVRIFKGHTADVEAIAFHPNGKWLLSVSEDKTIKLWDINSGNVLMTIVAYTDGQHLAYTPSGCYTGSADVGRHVKFLVRGVKQDLSDQIRQALFVADKDIPLLLGK